MSSRGVQTRLRKRDVKFRLHPEKVYVEFKDTPNKFTWGSSTPPNKFTWGSNTSPKKRRKVQVAPRKSVRGSQAHPRIGSRGSSSTLLDKVRESPVFYGRDAYFSYASGRRDGADKAIRDSLLRRVEGCTPLPHRPCGCRCGECGCSRRLCRARWRGRHTWGRTL